MSKSKPLTTAQLIALENCWWIPDGVWWHDLPPGSRDVLLRRGLICEASNPGCTTPGHKHPGYMVATRAGIDAINQDREARKRAA